MVQDFHHLSQGRQESVADFNLRLEQTFRRAYGCNKVCEETCHALLHAQLQEGLKYAIMEAPAVLGSQTYRELCMAAKNEERRQSKLAKRQEYTRTAVQSGSNGVPRAQARTLPRDQATLTHTPRPSARAPLQKRCYICNSPDHLANKCDTKQGESQGRSRQSTARRAVGSSEKPPRSRDIPAQEVDQNPLKWLHSSDSDEGDVCTVQVTDTGSKPQCARVMIQGVPVVGIIDTTADITIIGGTSFRKVANVAKLKKKNFKPPDITPHTYDQRSFELDSRMKLEVEFGGKTMGTIVYIKMDAREQLLLSEGVCRQLGIIVYHPEVQIWHGSRNEGTHTESNTGIVLLVTAKLVNSVQVLPQQCSVVSVELEGSYDATKRLLLEPEDLGCELQIDQMLLNPLTDDSGMYQVVIGNCTGFTQTLEKGATLGTAIEIEEIIPATKQGSRTQINHLSSKQVSRLTSNETTQWRKDKLCTLVDSGESALVSHQ